MSDSPTISAVIFDLDGTLYDRLRRVRVATSIGLWRSLGLLARLESARRSVRDQRFSDEAGLHDALARALAKRTGGEVASCLEWYRARFMPKFVDCVGRYGRVRDALGPTLDALGRGGIQRAVVSDYGRVDERLEALGIGAHRFEYRRSAEASGALKPDAGCFLAAAKGLRVAPEQCLVVGDRVDTDGVGAQAAGMHFWQVLDADPPARAPVPGGDSSAPDRPMREAWVWAKLGEPLLELPLPLYRNLYRFECAIFLRTTWHLLGTHLRSC